LYWKSRQWYCRRYMIPPLTDDERGLVALAVALGACQAGGELSEAERAAVATAQTPADPAAVAERRRLIRRGDDPLGESFCSVRTSAVRRKTGSFYTDPAIVDAMLRWVAEQQPAEVVDCGAGTGRFAIAAARLPGVKSVIAVEIDPVASLMLRARVAVLSIKTIRVLNRDFLTLELEPTKLKRAFVGKPP
jgi:adenine-specific DNA-methyltransferase